MSEVPLCAASDAKGGAGGAYRKLDIGPGRCRLVRRSARGLEMKDLRDLEDLTINDVKPISDK